LLNTLQWVYISLTVAAALLIWLSAPWVARHWLNSEGLPVEAIEKVVALMGIAIGSQMLVGFYSGGLFGLQRQVSANILSAIFGTVRVVGAVIVLWLFSPTVQAFFVWQVMAAIGAAVSTGIFLWGSLQGDARPSFRPDLIASSGRFAAGMGATSIISLLLNQADKLVLSKLLSLESFGYYALAASVASILHYVGAPIFSAFFPVLTQHLGKGDAAALLRQYHKASQVMAVALIPSAGMLIAFPQQILFVWTNDLQITTHSFQFLRLLGLAAALNVLASIPYCLQLAYGWTRLGLTMNSFAVLFVVPTLLLTVTQYGAFGAAVVSAVAGAVYLLIFVVLMHRRIFPGQHWRWLVEDVLPVVGAVLVVGIAAKLFLFASEARIVVALQLIAVYLLMVLAAFWRAPLVNVAVVAAIRGENAGV
jgi:O-antigen/teichoic acid export membrane protein